jgi:hypothetical protein
LTECKVPGGRKGATLKTHHGALNGGSKQILQKRTEALHAFRTGMTAGRDAQVILGLKGKPFQDALAINRAIETSALAPVLERSAHAFVGPLSVPPLSPAAQRRLARDVLFLCPLLGVLRPDDLVPDYRCPVGAHLPSIGSLHGHWKAPVTATLNRLLKGALVFSFLPARLSALWKPDGREAGIVVIRFSRLCDGRRVGETAAMPRLSAEALRFILENDVRQSSDLAAFRSSHGHAFSAGHGQSRGGVSCLEFVLEPARAATTSG